MSASEVYGPFPDRMRVETHWSIVPPDMVSHPLGYNPDEAAACAEAYIDALRQEAHRWSSVFQIRKRSARRAAQRRSQTFARRATASLTKTSRTSIPWRPGDDDA